MVVWILLVWGTEFVVWIAILVWGAITSQFNGCLDTVGLGYRVCCVDSNIGLGCYNITV